MDISAGCAGIVAKPWGKKITAWFPRDGKRPRCGITWKASACAQTSPFRGQVEVDESYFGPRRGRGKRGRGAAAYLLSPPEGM